jgi:hypothetical protein
MSLYIASVIDFMAFFNVLSMIIQKKKTYKKNLLNFYKYTKPIWEMHV